MFVIEIHNFSFNENWKQKSAIMFPVIINITPHVVFILLNNMYSTIPNAGIIFYVS